MKIDILTLFPEMFPAVLSAGVVGRAAEKGLLEFDIKNIRDFSDDKHKKADDYPFGGGAGQLMTAQPIFAAMKTLNIDKSKPARNISKPARNIYLSPRGKLLDKTLAEELAGESRLVLLCGHYEGVDQRALDAFDFEEVSIGDYVLTGGEIPALVLIDTVCRLVPGVLGSDESHKEESIYSGLLEYPQYTRPASFEEMDVPETLLSGDHKKIALWNFEQALAITAKRRPDLLKSYLAEHYDALDKAHQALAQKYLMT